MTLVHAVAALAGTWTGENQLWLHPEQPARESQTTATVALVAGGRFASIRYDWAEGGEPQDGLLVIGPELADGAVTVVWVDSFHMGDQFMTLQGKRTADGHISVLGSYAASPGPDWGWRIVIEPALPDSFRLLMFNITPDGQEFLAVRAVYVRKRER